ncbi:hypothetical protein PCANC_21905 [Puccinia coronata f. sp. avenae]|uniref:Uncharacterized protein n=1 Tax=Puccinia coronata f. sp. avenae TaxID=200324 RepID=A0A2N5U7U1_9BASI|nr:hypothetical protein PCANC_21905 [Puccinia coronata f. sp. avenae]
MRCICDELRLDALVTQSLREPGRTGVPAVHACPEGVQGLHALQTGVHGQHACPAGPHAEPAVLTPFVGMRTACGMRGRRAGVCTPVWEGVQPPHAFFLGVQGGVRTPFGRAAIKPQSQDQETTQGPNHHDG